MNLYGKRVLHLGGALFQIPSLACAKKLGCHVILVDQNPEVPGRTCADSFEQVSTRDIENVLNVAKEYKIDGVMTYASDSSVITVAHVAQQMGLPGNPVKAAESLRRKDLFREFQEEIELPHPFFFATDSLGEAIERVDTLEFPLVVKPVDASGTKGQTIIYGKREVARAFEDSSRQSLVKRVIFENFIRTDMMELDGDVWFKNRKLAFRHYGHNHFLENRISNVPSGEIFPGFFGDELAMQIDRQFQKIIEGLALNSGCMNFDALASDGKVYIVDIGLRNGGNFVPDLIKLSTGFDLTEAAIYSALGIDYPDSGLYCKAPEPVASYLIGSRFRGRFEGLDVNQEIKEYVVETKLFSEIGSEVKPFTKADFAVGIMFLRFPDMDMLKEKISVIEDMVKLRIVPIRLPQKQYTENSQERSPKPGTSILGNFKEFPELISPFLRNKLAKAEEENNQTILRVISRQYIESLEEQSYDAEDELKHYEAGETLHWQGERLYGVERLYLIELSYSNRYISALLIAGTV